MRLSDGLVMQSEVVNGHILAVILDVEPRSLNVIVFWFLKGIAGL